MTANKLQELQDIYEALENDGAWTHSINVCRNLGEFGGGHDYKTVSKCQDYVMRFPAPIWVNCMAERHGVARVVAAAKNEAMSCIFGLRTKKHENMLQRLRELDVDAVVESSNSNKE